jgi:signal transduction histidine kinase
MNQIVDRMLTASRMLDTSTAIEVQPVLVDQVVHDVRESLELIRAKHQTVRIDGIEGVRAQADPEQLETILRNLLSNAIKYSPDGGDIIVSIDADPEWVTIAVKDRGLGIDEADIPKLFQPFRRLDKAQSAGIEGTGLGLYLSRQLAVAQGGDIEVESQPNEGSTFRLRLPRASD